jgi:hypothetical protein
MYSSPTLRSREKTGVEVVLDRRLAGEIELRAGIVPAALCMSSVWPFPSAGSIDETIDAVAACGETAPATTKRPVGSFRAARRAAVASAGTIAAALGSLRATKVNEPVERWPNWSRRIVSARPGACFSIERRAPCA